VPKIDNILPVITSEKGAISFLMDNDVGNFHVCPKCKHEGKHGWKKKWPSDDSPLINDNLRLKCCAPCAGTKHTWSPFVGTFFGNSSLKKYELIRIVYFWANGCTIDQTKQMTGHAENTVAIFFQFLREVCVADLINRGAHNRIGGYGIVVEIDESKYGKRKYHRGHQVEGNWVFGAIERLYDHAKQKYFAGRFILLVVENRERETLSRIIRAFIEPGLFIISDCHKSYENINDWEGENMIPLPHKVQYDENGNVSKKQKLYDHESVNHSKFYKDPITGAYTNTIEGHWRVSKSKIPKRLYADAQKLQEYLFEQQWEKIPRIHELGKFYGMIECLKYVEYNKEDSNASYTMSDPEKSEKLNYVNNHCGEHNHNLHWDASVIFRTLGNFMTI
jgi:hypothetical protein